MAHADSHDHSHAAPDGDPAHAEVHHYDYVRIWGILVVLLIISVLGPMIGILYVTLITAFGIAFVKAYMVARYFMHVNVQQPVVHYFLVTALVFMVLFFSAVSPDVMRHDGQGWSNDAAKAETARVLADVTAHHGDAHEGGGHEAPEGSAHEGGEH